MPSEMLMKNVTTILATLIISATTAVAQLQLPQLDIEAKGGYGLIDAGSSDVIKRASFKSIQGALHIQINQRIAIGGFYSKAIGGDVEYSSGTDAKYNLNVLMYGADIRFSAGRSAKWRPYLGLVYGQAEFVQEAAAVNLASKTTIMGVNAGIMLRFGRNFYWNVVEVSPRFMPDKIWWLNSDFCLEAKTGFLYNIRLKTK
jgi:hypothetical protein